jgi:hypothetical protein
VKRREFITLIGGAAASWPLAAPAQQPAKVRTIGFLGSGTPITAGAWVVAFAQRLQELGWIEDRTIKIDLRWAEGRNDRSGEIAAEFVRLKVDVIVTYSPSKLTLQRRRPRLSQLSSHSRQTLSVAIWSLVWRGPAAILLACRPRMSISPASGSSCCARSFRVCVDWRSCSTATTRPPCQRSASFGPLPAPSVSRYLHRRFWVPKILAPPSRRSRSRLMRCS